MKIMQVNVVYPNGSTGKIMKDINDELISRNYQTVICYGRKKRIKEKNVYKTSLEILAKINALRTRIFGYEYAGAFFSTKKLLKIINNEKPDVVHLHCLNGYFVNIYKLLEYLKNNHIKTVLTLHAEFMYTGNCSHSCECDKWKKGCNNCENFKSATKSYFFDVTSKAWKKMKKSFENFNDISIIAVSDWVAQRARQSGIMQGHKINVIKNGIDIEVFNNKYDFELEKQYRKNNEKLLLHVTSGSNNKIKGFNYIIELANSIKNDNIKILLIGNDDKNIELPSNIINIGKVYDQEKLAKYYSLADLTILTSKRETFSMICAESLSCGTPVIGFKAGAPELISIKDYSEFVEYGDINQLKRIIKKWLEKDIDKEKISSIAKDVYSNKKMVEEYIKIYKGKEKK